MTVEENLEMGAYTQARSAIEPGLERVYEQFPRLKERRRQVAGTLSGGEQQMLAEGHLGILLHQQDGDARLVQLADDLKDLFSRSMTACSTLSPYFMASRNTASPPVPSSAIPHQGMDTVALPTMQASGGSGTYF